MPDHLAVGELDGVHRRERGGCGGQGVEMRHHDLLARVGDVQAAETHPAGFGQQRAGLLGRQAESFDIYQLVEVPEAQFVRLPLVQLRTQRCADLRANQAHEVPRFTGDHLLDDLSRA